MVAGRYVAEPCFEQDFAAAQLVTNLTLGLEMLEGCCNSPVVFHRRCLVLIMVRPLRTSPCRWGLARGLPEVLAHVRLVGEAAPKRNVTQRRIGRKHVLSRQFHATSYDERVR